MFYQSTIPKKVKNSIKDFLYNDFESYYQNNYANSKGFSKRYFQDMDKGFRKTGFTITSIREIDKSEVIEILVFQQFKDDYTSVIFIFNTETKQVIGFY